MNSYQELFAKKGFVAFLCCQFLGALNDNLYKTVVSLLVIDKAAHGGWLSLAAVVFLLPSFFFSGFSGYFADKYSKQKVMMVTKGIEIGTMALAFSLLPTENHLFLLVILFLIASQSVFFSPAKYGIVPEVLPRTALSRANGLLETSTFLAIIIGTVSGGVLLHYFRAELHIIGIVLITLSVLGFIASLFIMPSQAAHANKSFSLNPLQEVSKGFARLSQDKTLLLVVLAISYFWGLGMAVQQNIFLFGKTALFGANLQPVGDLGIALLNCCMGIGIAIGGLVAGKVSGLKIEFGIIPLGGAMMGVFLGLAALAVPVAWQSYGGFLLAGVAAGFYIVPLYALLQAIPYQDEKGRLIATNNFCNGIAMLLAAATVWFLRSVLDVSPSDIFVLLALLTLVISIAIMVCLPHGFYHTVFWIFTHFAYRVTLVGANNIPQKGGALLVVNHVSYLDGILLTVLMPRKVRCLVYKPFYENPWLNWIFRAAESIPVESKNSKAIRVAVDDARSALLRGELVCIFAEGAISRTGNLLPFRRGLERIMEGLDVPIIPAHFEGLWGSRLSLKKKGQRRRVPTRFSLPVVISFAQALASDSKAWQVRQAVQELGSEALFLSKDYRESLPIQLLQSLRFHAIKSTCLDSSGQQIKGGEFVAQVLLLSRYFKKRTQRLEEVGVCLLPGVDSALVNAALAFAGCVAVNIPYGRRVTRYQDIIKEKNISLVITNLAVLGTLGLAPQYEMVYLDDIRVEQKWRHCLAFILSLLTPAAFSLRCYGRSVPASSPLAVVFESQGPGYDGVVLSHRSVAANVVGMEHIYPPQVNSALLAVMPAHTALGLSSCLWFPLITRTTLVAQTNYRDFTALSTLLQQQPIDILINTPSGYRRLLKGLNADDLKPDTLAIVGGAVLSERAWQRFSDKFGIELLEGYGCAEMGPMISVSSHNHEEDDMTQQGQKAGSVGLPLFGLAVKIMATETEQVCLAESWGILLVKGPGQMVGYWRNEQPEATQHGWFNTGKQAMIDRDGFLYVS